MGFFSKLFHRKPAAPGPEQDINKLLERFTTATIMGIDREDLGRFPPKQYKVMAFHYGAIEYLAQLHELDDTRTLGIFVVFINRYFNMPITETGSITERLQGFHDDPEQRRYLQAGAEIFRRWHEQKDRRAPLELGVMLKES